MRLYLKDGWYGYLFVAPLVLGYLAFQLGPILTAFGMSFTDWAVVGETRFIGIDNYKRAFTLDPVFWQTFWNSLYFSAGLVPLNMIFALLLALLLKERILGMSIFRTIIFTPVVTSIVAWAIVFKYIFQTDSGLVNMILKLFNYTGPAWLYDANLAMPVLIFVSVLKGVGYNMVIFLAALNDVPKIYYEAARIDGATGWKSFWNVTVPLITPSLFMVLILTMIGSLKAFGQIYVMTEGGPGTSTYVFVYYIYQQAFKLFELGYASAIAFVLFSIILCLTLIQWNVRKKWVHYES